MVRRVVVTVCLAGVVLGVARAEPDGTGAAVHFVKPTPTIEWIDSVPFAGSSMTAEEVVRVARMALGATPADEVMVRQGRLIDGLAGGEDSLARPDWCATAGARSPSGMPRDGHGGVTTCSCSL